MAPSDNKSLKQIADEKNKQNPSQLGDPVSMKAETSNTEVTEHDRGAGGDGKSLKQIAQDKMKTNPSMLGDPVSLKAETADSEPTENDRGAAGTSKNSGKPKM